MTGSESKVFKVASHSGFDMLTKVVFWVFAVIVFPLAIYAYSQDQRHQDKERAEIEVRTATLEERTGSIDVLTTQIDNLNEKIDDIADDVKSLVRQGNP